MTMTMAVIDDTLDHYFDPGSVTDDDVEDITELVVASGGRRIPRETYFAFLDNPLARRALAAVANGKGPKPSRVHKVSADSCNRVGVRSAQEQDLIAMRIVRVALRVNHYRAIDMCRESGYPPREGRFKNGKTGIGITQEEIAKVKEKYPHLYGGRFVYTSLSDVAKKFGVHRDSIVQACERLDIVPRHPVGKRSPGLFLTKGEMAKVGKSLGFGPRHQPGSQSNDSNIPVAIKPRTLQSPAVSLAV